MDAGRLYVGALVDSLVGALIGPDRACTGRISDGGVLHVRLTQSVVLSFFINPIGASDQAWGAIATILLYV